MKTLEEVKQIKQSFRDEYRPAFIAVGNNLMTGIGKDDQTGDYTIVANLTNDSLKTSLPDNYQGVKVVVSVIGEIFALE